jgi:hypothetical protein
MSSIQSLPQLAAAAAAVSVVPPVPSYRRLSTSYNNLKLRWFLEPNRVTGAARYQGRGATGEEPMVLVPAHQRDYVWNHKKQQALIDSVFRGFPIPALMVTEDHRNRLILQDGQQRLETLYRFYSGEFTYEGRRYADLPEEQQLRFLEFTVPIIDTTGATPDEVAEIYDRLNQGVALSHGEKYWNQRTKPLVALTESLLMRRGEGLQPLAASVFGDYLSKRDPRHNLLANAVGYVAGAAFGQDGISTSYNILCSRLGDPIDEDIVRRRLTTLFNIYKAADERQAPKTATKRKAQWKLGLFSAYILYSILHTEHDEDLLQEICDLWEEFLVVLRSTRTRELENAVERILKAGMPRSNNITCDRLETGYLNMAKLFELGVDYLQSVGEGKAVVEGRTDLSEEGSDEEEDDA